jgi:formylglycine-generating enzyme required for sulfatase activity
VFSITPARRSLVLVFLFLSCGCSETSNQPVQGRDAGEASTLDTIAPNDGPTESSSPDAPHDVPCDTSSDWAVNNPSDSAFDALPLEADAASDCVHPLVVADCSEGWCRIPKGCFLIGSPQGEWGRAKYIEEQVQVTLTDDFLVQEKETTQAQWLATGLPNPSQQTAEYLCSDPNCPVGNMNWFEAAYFTNVYSENASPPLPPCYAFEGCTGEVGQGMVCEKALAVGGDLYACPGYRLPTEAEWEYAARAGTTTAFYNGDITPLSNQFVCGPDPNLEQIAWYCGNAGADSSTRVGGLKPPNAWGLYDVLGNVTEWVNDQLITGYGSIPLVDPGKELEAKEKELGIRRGGLAVALAPMCRSANRMQAPRWGRGAFGGLRMVRSLG